MVALCFNTFNRSPFLGVEPDLPGQIVAAAEAGFTLFGPDVFALDAWVAAGNRLDDLERMLADHGMACWEIAGIIIGDREPTLAAAEHIAELAAVLHPQWVLTNVMEGDPRTMGQTFDDACWALERGGCRPAVEYLPFTPLDSIAAARQLVGTVGTDRAKVLFDTWHHFRGPDTWEDLEAAPAELVAYVQFDDALPMESGDLLDETLMRRTFPGLGEFDLARYCSVMRAKGFDGVVSVEILNREWRESDDLRAFAKQAHDTTARLWA
jgi:sugar phosphate isomerase/epimerase